MFLRIHRQVWNVFYHKLGLTQTCVETVADGGGESVFSQSKNLSGDGSHIHQMEM